jgi:hypothetical protein
MKDVLILLHVFDKYKWRHHQKMIKYIFDFDDSIMYFSK